MEIKESRIAAEDWYEIDLTKTGWDSNGLYFLDSGSLVGEDWTVVSYIRLDKFGNPTILLVEKITEII